MKQASKETRERAIASWKLGVPIDQICSVLNISRRTFYSWRKRDAESGEQTPLPKGHRPARLNGEHLAKIRELVDANNSIFAREIRDALGINCALSVIYRALAKLGYTLKKRVVSKRTK